MTGPRSSVWIVGAVALALIAAGCARNVRAVPVSEAAAHDARTRGCILACRSRHHRESAAAKCALDCPGVARQSGRCEQLAPRSNQRYLCSTVKRDAGPLGDFVFETIVIGVAVLALAALFIVARRGDR